MKKLIIILATLVVVLLGFTPYFLSAKKEKDLEQCKLRKQMYPNIEIIFSDGCYVDMGNGVFLSTTLDSTLYTRKQVMEKSHESFVIEKN